MALTNATSKIKGALRVVKAAEGFLIVQREVTLGVATDITALIFTPASLGMHVIWGVADATIRAADSGGVEQIGRKAGFQWESTTSRLFFLKNLTVTAGVANLLVEFASTDVVAGDIVRAAFFGA